MKHLRLLTGLLVAFVLEVLGWYLMLRVSEKKVPCWLAMLMTRMIEPQLLRCWLGAL